MKIIVGSKNPTKVQAAKEAFSAYKEFKNAEFFSKEVESGVHKQPKSIEVTVQGAITRAKNAWGDCDLSVGIESGLMPVPETKSGYMDITICAIYEGKNFHLGGSYFFEYPKSMIDIVLRKDVEISEAAKEIGITEKENVGYSEGMIGILSNGVLDRIDHSKHAVLTAIIHLLHPDHY